MKKEIIFIVALILVAALTVYNTFTLGKIKNEPMVAPVFNQQIVQSPKITQSSNYDIVGNLIISNKLRFDPIVTVDNSLLGRGIGDVWNDATNEALRFWDGNYPLGVKIAMGKFGYDDIEFVYGGEDTIAYPTLLDLGYNVSYEVMYDSLGTDSVQITIQDAENDTLWASMDSVLFPDFVNTGALKKIWVSSMVKYNNRVIIDWNDAEYGDLTLRRRVALLK